MLDRYEGSFDSDAFGAAGVATEAVGEPAWAMVAATLCDECAHRRIVKDDDADISVNAMAVATGVHPGRPKDEVSMRVHDSGAESMFLVVTGTFGLLATWVVRKGNRHTPELVRCGKAGAQKKRHDQALAGHHSIALRRP
jgi:hypothetical protein